jgi:hypothetical protein
MDKPYNPELEQSENRIAQKLNVSTEKVLVCHTEDMDIGIYIADKLTEEEISEVEDMGHSFSYMNKNINQTVFFHKNN